MSFSVGHTDRNKQWLSDASLLKNLRVLDNVQVASNDADWKTGGAQVSQGKDAPAPAQAMESR